MSGLQDENSFSAGGGTEGGEKKKQVAQVSRPDPAAVRAAVEQQIATAKQAAAAAKKAAKTEFSTKVSEIVDNLIDTAGEADDTRLSGIDTAALPVLDQQAVIRNIEAQLRQAKMDLNAKKVVFKAAKGELKSAYKQAVSGIWETTRADIEAAKSAREQAVIAAKEALTEALNKGADTVQEEEALADAYDNWQSDMKWAGRKAGFNAVAQTVAAIVNAAKEVYKEAAATQRAAVPVPAVLLNRNQPTAGGPQAPSA
jgi:ribosomal protein L17